MFSHCQTLANRIMRLIRQALKILMRLNLFLDAETLHEQNVKKLRDQILATRVYLVIFIVVLTAVTLLISLSTNVISVTVLEPSMDTYDRLATDHSETLSCVCKKVSITYGEFVSLAFTPHPVRFLVKLVTA